MGHGGVTLISRATGLSRTTINNGIPELEQGRSLSGQRVRREGGGRKKVTDQQPALVETLDGMVEPTAKGDPMSPLRWTVHSTRRLAAFLQERGFSVSHMQVYKLLSEMKYRLAGNRKSIEGGTNPDQNTQFEFINTQSATFLTSISVRLYRLFIYSPNLRRDFVGNRRATRPDVGGGVRTRSGIRHRRRNATQANCGRQGVERGNGHEEENGSNPMFYSVEQNDCKVKKSTKS